MRSHEHPVQLGPAQLGDGAGAQRRVRLRGAVQGRVVEDHVVPVGTEVDVALEQRGALGDTAPEGAHGVLGLERRGAPVSDEGGLRRGHGRWSSWW
jgi:hypothetical protein